MGNEALIKIFERDYTRPYIEKVLLTKPFLKQAKELPVRKFKKTFVGLFVTRHPKYSHLIGYICDALGVEVPTWDDFTKVNLRAISDYINAVVAPNSAATYIHVILAFLREYNEENILPVKSLSRTMKVKKVPSQHVSLTMDELKRFEEYVPKTRTEKDVKCLFMRACYTGARCSDAYELSTNNIIDGKTLSYVSKKTKVEVVLPLHQNLRKYLEYDITKKYSAKTTCDVVRRICKTIGMKKVVSLYVGGVQRNGFKWEFISMHSARRTFCTILAQMGVNVETIRTMAGHTTSAMTDRYICLDGRNPGNDAMRFFQGQPAKSKQKCVNY